MDAQDKELLEKALDYATKASNQAEILLYQNISTPVGFEAEQLKDIETRESWGIGIRVIKDGKIGISSTNNPENYMLAIERAQDLSKFGPEAHFSFPSDQNFGSVNTIDPSVGSIPIERMIESGKSMIQEVKPGKNDVLFDAGLQKSTSQFGLVNSNGLSFSYEKSSFSSWLSGTLIRGTDMLFVSERKRGIQPDWDFGPLISGVERQLDWGKNTVDSPSGNLPVLFMPRAVISILLSPFLSGINGKSVLHGSSPLADKIGTRIFDERISIYDDPWLNNKLTARFADDEGVPTVPRHLVKNGMLETILYDLQTGGQSGKESTGNASRGLGSMPTVTSSYLTIAEGNSSTENLLGKIKDGIVVEQLIGMGQGNTLGGDAGGNILLGYRVKNGVIKGRVKDTMLNCNIYDALNNLDEVGNESEEIGGSLLSPPILCGDISISPRQGK
jgi:PmbA protein